MTFEEAKSRSDYQFDINELDSIIEDIRKGSMDSLFENGDPYRESDDYVDDYKPSVDWTADNWRDLLEKDMFQALDQYVTKKAYSCDFPN